MKKRPIVLVHGYSDKGESFKRWCSELTKAGYDMTELKLCSYESLTNEITIKDVGEAFDRALKLQADIHPDKPFDAIVHSTGMLVVRAWLTGRDRSRISRLKHLVALAPATFGSPLAHKGRSTLGSIFKGNRAVGPDFLEAGDLILDGLELASRFQWELTHQDVLNATPVYGDGPDTPWVFTFCGTEAYSGLRRLVNAPGTDGTVRWAGCSLSCRKVDMDLTRPSTEQRVLFDSWKHIAAPTVFVKGLTHATIMSDPPPELVQLVTSAFEVNSNDHYAAWQTRAAAVSHEHDLVASGRAYQQFVVRAVDERGDPVSDYHVEVFTRGGDPNGKQKIIEAFDDDPHPYAADKSLRCFHVNLANVVREELKDLWLRVIVSSGSKLVAYQGYGTSAGARPQVLEVGGESSDDEGSTELEIDLTEHLPQGPGTDFFVPFTTTLVEIRFNREPFPFEGATKLLRWLPDLSGG
jgi:hypothetical protein